MKLRSPVPIAFFMALALTASSACATPIEWNVETVQSSGTPLMTISDAVSLLNGGIAHSVDVTAQSPTLNFNLPDHPLGGKFTGDSAFPGITSANEDDFAVNATASINITTPGNYTFGVSSDDGFEMTVGSNFFEFAGPRAPAETYATFNFPTPGAYPVDLTYFQHQTAAELEFFASPGTFTSVGQSGSNFQLVGDTADGGLSLINPALPEPSPTLFLGPMVVGFLLRRRSMSKRSHSL